MMFRDVDGKLRNNEKSKVSECFDCLLGKILKKRFGEKGGIAKLARLLGLSNATVEQWVSGLVTPPSDIQARISRVLGMKSRADIWVFKEELAPSARRVAQLFDALQEEEKKFTAEYQDIQITPSAHKPVRRCKTKRK